MVLIKTKNLIKKKKKKKKKKKNKKKAAIGDKYIQ